MAIDFKGYALNNWLLCLLKTDCISFNDLMNSKIWNYYCNSINMNDVCTSWN